MARVEVPIVVLNTTTGLPVNGAAVAISSRATGTPTTWWTTETGGTSSTAAVISDTNGRVTAWVARGAYNLSVTGTGLTPYTEAWDAVPGVDGSIDTLWIGDASVTNQKIASGLDASKLTVGTLPAARLGSNSVGSNQIVDGAVGLAEMAVGVGGRIIGATAFGGYALGANGNTQLVNYPAIHNNKSGWVFLMGAVMNTGAAAGACGHRIYLDGVAWNASLATVNAGRSASLAGAWFYNSLNGTHNWSVNIELGNNPTTIENAGSGLIVIVELY